MTFRELLENQKDKALNWLERDMKKLDDEKEELENQGQILNKMIDNKKKKYSNKQIVLFKRQRRELVAKLDDIKSKQEKIELEIEQIKIS